MKNRLMLFAAVFSLVSAQLAPAADQSPAATDLKDLVQQVQTKLKDGKRSAADLAPELKQFDALLEKYKGQKTDDVADILRMKGILYLQVLEDDAKALTIMEQIKKDFPETKAGKGADQTIASIKKGQESKKIRDSLAVGTKFPDFSEKDVAGKPLSLANYKGKVVLIDFWATWCGPCVQELPNVLKAYEDYHPKGFEIIGISLDKDQDKLATFTKDKKMPWQQFFDGKGWENKLSTKYGVNSIPATYLVDGSGVIIGKNLRGEELSKAVAKALEKK